MLKYNAHFENAKVQRTFWKLKILPAKSKATFYKANFPVLAIEAAWILREILRGSNCAAVKNSHKKYPQTGPKNKTFLIRIWACMTH